ARRIHRGYEARRVHAPRILWGANVRKFPMISSFEKFAAPAAALAAYALLAIAAPTARADDYCITNGAQAAHGCGYPTMEACRAASAGIGGSCSLSASSKNPSDAMAYQPKQPQSRAKLKSGKNPAAAQN